MKENLKNNKKLLLFILPIGLVLLLAMVISTLLDDTKEIPSNASKSPESFIPNSEEENKHETKLDAYKTEQSEHRKKEQEKQLSQVKNSDFFRDLLSDEEEAQEEVKIKETETAEEFYERSIMQKETKQAPKQYANNNNPSNNTKQSSSNKLSEKKPVKKEDDPIKVLYNEATGTQSDIPQQSSTAVLDNKRRRAQSSNNTANESNLVRACIHGDQTVTSGATVRMRLIEEIQLDGAVIPANTIFYGVASIQSERLSVKISSIKYGNTIKNLSYQVYDNDAIQGLNLPDNVKAEFRKKGTSSAINNIEAPNVASGTIIGSTVGSTVDVAKQVLKRSEQEIKISLKANYNIFLK